MTTLTYALQFRRPPKGAGPEQNATASSISMVCKITSNGVSSEIKTIAGLTATLRNQFALNNTQNLFFEWGTIEFGSSANSLQFSSVGAGELLSDVKAGKYSHGVVMWKVTGGSGAFKGATGAITSNFLVDLDTDELIDNQFHLIHLPT
jgi:hypothetical protein